LDPLNIILLFLAGLAAGIINTVGGGGSILTLPALIFIGGVPSVAANATNRLGIIMQNATALWRFRKGGVKEDRLALILTSVALPGTVIGSLLASGFDSKSFNTVLAWLMLALLALVLFKPKPRLKKDDDSHSTDSWNVLPTGRKVILLLLMFLVGVYMGFIQAGGGIIILVMLGYLMDLSLVRGNYIKLMIIFVTNFIAFGVFIYNGIEIYWLAGVVVFLGQIAGAYAGSWIALKKGENWMKAILTISILASSAKLLGWI
jgi:uncharacterized membrane protein YfcA